MRKHTKLVGDTIGDARKNTAGVRSDFFEYLILRPLCCCMWAPNFMIGWAYRIHFALTLKDLHIRKNQITELFIENYEREMIFKGYPLVITEKRH
ncbi:hypothetical protein IKE82_01995 [Candidatus Saccharibacteria bacterium]|nr:hypothetical protein [Candidatus Saccharibacteria bacterium]